MHNSKIMAILVLRQAHLPSAHGCKSKKSRCCLMVTKSYSLSSCNPLVFSLNSLVGCLSAICVCWMLHAQPIHIATLSFLRGYAWPVSKGTNYLVYTATTNRLVFCYYVPRPFLRVWFTATSKPKEQTPVWLANHEKHVVVFTGAVSVTKAGTELVQRRVAC